MTKRIIAVLLAVMMLFTIPAFGATVATGTNGNSIYLSFAFSNDDGAIDSVAKGETFYIDVNYSNNPSVAANSIQAFDMFIGYNAEKITVDSSYGDVIEPTTNTDFAPGVIATGWAGEKGIVKKGKVVTDGILLTIVATANTDISQYDLKGIVSILGSYGSDVTGMYDGAGKSSSFNIIVLPGIEVGAVSGKVYKTTSADEVKAMLSGFSFIDGANNKTPYGQNDPQWADLTITKPADIKGGQLNAFTASYNGYTCTFDVYVEDAIESIAVTTAPSKIEYTAFEKFDKTGMVVTATYESGNKKDVTSDVVIVDENKDLLVKDTKIEISYEGAVAYQNITVAPKEIARSASRSLSAFALT